MGKNQKCSECDQNKKIGHNYCRHCGYHLTKGYVQYVRLAHAYSTNDKFCGYCGNTRKECKC
jgi:hypothetical protein